MSHADDRDMPLLDDLGLSLAAEHELSTGADLLAVRARLMEAALEECDAPADVEMPVAAPVVALSEREPYQTLPSVWWSSARTSLMVMGAVFLVLLAGGTLFMLSRLKVNDEPIVSLQVGPDGLVTSIERKAVPGVPGVMRVRRVDEVSSNFPVRRVSGNTHEILVPVALGTTDPSVTVTMTLAENRGATIRHSVEMPIVPGREPSVRRLTVNPDELMASKVLRQDERQMLEAMMDKAPSFEVDRPLTDSFLWPIAGAEDDVSSNFGELRVFDRTDEAGADVTTVFDRHLGVDVRGRRGEPVLAAQRGWVMASMQLEHGGVTVLVQHRQGVYSVYQHLEASEVKEGDVVDRGQRIGANGSSGAASRPHVHFGIYARGAWIDPSSLID
jgi:murein DD-endopeptidase MepM/ murein hydrolase activator NlpD